MNNLLLSVNPEHMHNPKLDLLDKLILSYVSTWEQKGLVCYAKDSFFTQLFGEPEGHIQFSLAKLESLQLLHVVRGPGGRVLQTIKSLNVETQNVTDIFEGIY